MVSRVAKNPVAIPTGVEVNIVGQDLKIKGKLGQLAQNIHPLVAIKNDNNLISLLPVDSSVEANALAGTSRAIINNMVKGVSLGFEKKLVLVGVGYRARVEGKVLHLTVGYSHPVSFDLPEGITAETPSATEIVIKGIDKQKLGQVAANVRSVRAPEPYKGKGIRYANERIILKEVKKK